MSQTENQPTEHLFFKVNLDAIKRWDDPLVAQIGSDNFATLCVLAAFMNERKSCYPTMATIGRCLGVTPQTASDRVQKLRKCRIDGVPVIEVSKDRVKGGRFANNRYLILTPAISIFHSDDAEFATSTDGNKQEDSDELLKEMELVDRPWH